MRISPGISWKAWEYPLWISRISLRTDCSMTTETESGLQRSSGSRRWTDCFSLTGISVRNMRWQGLRKSWMYRYCSGDPEMRDRMRMVCASETVSADCLPRGRYWDDLACRSLICVTADWRTWNLRMASAISWQCAMWWKPSAAPGFCRLAPVPLTSGPPCAMRANCWRSSIFSCLLFPCRSWRKR